MDTKELQEKLIIFLDAIGRVIIGEEIKERATDTSITVKNPTIVHVEPKNGNISIQFFPVFFKEFLGSKTEGTTFTYNRNVISLCDHMVLDFKLYAQYMQMYYGAPQAVPAKAPTPPQQPPASNVEPPVIKLFED